MPDTYINNKLTIVSILFKLPVGILDLNTRLSNENLLNRNQTIFQNKI